MISRRMFDYDRRLLPHPLLASLEAEASDIESAVARTGLTVGYPAWNLLYFACLCSLPIDREEVHVVETGTNQGFSTIVLAEALRAAGKTSPVQTVDIDPEVNAKAREHVQAAGLTEHVTFHVEDSLRFLERYCASVPCIDFAFLDGNHEADHVVAEFDLLHDKLSGSNSTVYFDNTTRLGMGDEEHVAVALERIQARYGGNLVEFKNCSWHPPGNAIWQPPRS